MSWAEIIAAGLIEVAALILAGLVGARLQARYTRNQSLELDNIQRRREGLLEFLKHLRVIRLRVEAVLAGEAEPHAIKWVPSAPGMPQPYVREIPVVDTWVFSDAPDTELQKWDSIVFAIHETERAW